MNADQLFEALPPGKIVTVVISDKLESFNSRWSWYTYFGNYDPTIELYGDSESKSPTYFHFLRYLNNKVYPTGEKIIIKEYSLPSIE
jgi:hypothetical protein